jgi:hypothetical protein
MNEKSQDSNVPPAAAPEKKSYHSPQMREYGTIRELTLTTSGDYPIEPDPPEGAIYVTSY